MYKVNARIRYSLVAAFISFATVAPCLADTNSWGWVTLWSGAKLQDPYSIAISGHTATLAPSHSSTDGYLELNLNTRFVLRSGKFDDLLAAGSGSEHG